MLNKSQWKPLQVNLLTVKLQLVNFQEKLLSALSIRLTKQKKQGSNRLLLIDLWQIKKAKILKKLTLNPNKKVKSLKIIKRKRNLSLKYKKKIISRKIVKSPQKVRNQNKAKILQKSENKLNKKV